jgi:hypothetical protein
VPEPSGGASAWQIAAIFFVVIAPVYLILRFFVGLVRDAYGFRVPADPGPEYRICGSCHNTVMEDDFSHCPYCGTELPRPDAPAAP